MIKELITDESILSERSNEFDVTKENDLALDIVQDLCDTLNSLDDRLFLTAKEIGYNQRAFAIKFDSETNVFLNPAYKTKDKLIIFREKDLFSDKEYFIPRFSVISLAFQDFSGKVRGFKFNEGASIIVSQAMNLLDGILDSDIGLEVLPEFDKASKEEQEEVLAEYTKSLIELSKELDNELSTDEETKEAWGCAKFIKAHSEGKVETEAIPLSNRKKKKLNKLLKLIKRSKKH